MNKIFCCLPNGPFALFFTIQQAFIKVQIILGPLCFLLFLYLSFWKTLPQPSINPHKDLKRIPPLNSLSPMDSAKDLHKRSPWDSPVADFISWAAFMIYTEISPPLLSPAVIPEQDVAHKSFPSAYLPPTDQLIFTRVAISHTLLV